MEMDELPVSPPINPHSILSLVLGILTLLSFCTGFIPIPFTGFICFPASSLLGVFALVFGLIALRRIKKNYESGLPMAWIGIVIGGLVFLWVLCMIVVIISLFSYAPGSFPTPPFIEKYL